MLSQQAVSVFSAGIPGAMMWVDDRGVFHTVSLPDPSLLVGESAVRFIRRAGRLKRPLVRQVLEDQEERFFEAAAEIEAIALCGTELPYPQSPVLGNVSSIKDLRTRLAEVPITWRLDAITALDELLE